MQKRTGQFPSHNDTDQIAYTVYAPEQAPLAILQISHGMCEYLARYEGLAAYLTDRRVLVCGNDHLGHGRSVSTRERLGYFAAKNGWTFLAEDTHTLTRRMKETYLDLPYFLLGHSMGSFVLRDYLSRYGDEIDGAILCGTSGGEALGRMGIMLAGLIATVKGPFYRSPFLKHMAFHSYNRRYSNIRTDFDWLTRNSAVVDQYIADPYCNYIFTASGFRDLFRLLNHISSNQWYQRVPKQLPIFLISGDMDPVGKYGTGVKKVFAKLQAAGVKNIDLKLYQGGRHEILNEENREEVYGDLFAWLEEKRCPALSVETTVNGSVGV